jgi:hypothetical protein
MLSLLVIEVEFSQEIQGNQDKSIVWNKQIAKIKNNDVR